MEGGGCQLKLTRGGPKAFGSKRPRGRKGRDGSGAASGGGGRRTRAAVGRLGRKAPGSPSTRGGAMGCALRGPAARWAGTRAGPGAGGGASGARGGGASGARLPCAQARPARGGGAAILRARRRGERTLRARSRQASLGVSLANSVKGIGAVRHQAGPLCSRNPRPAAAAAAARAEEQPPPPPPPVPRRSERVRAAPA